MFLGLPYEHLVICSLLSSLQDGLLFKVSLTSLLALVSLTLLMWGNNIFHSTIQGKEERVSVKYMVCRLDAGYQAWGKCSLPRIWVPWAPMDMVTGSKEASEGCADTTLVCLVPTSPLTIPPPLPLDPWCCAQTFCYPWTSTVWIWPVQSLTPLL